MANQGWMPCSSDLPLLTDTLPARNIGWHWDASFIFCSIIALFYVLTEPPWNLQTLFCSPGNQADISTVCMPWLLLKGSTLHLSSNRDIFIYKYTLLMASFSLSSKNFCLFLYHVRNKKSGYKIAHVQQCSITRHWALQKWAYLI